MTKQPTSAGSLRNLVSECLAAINRERPEHERFEISGSTALLAQDGVLDSLELVSFLTELEARLRKLTGKRLNLASDALTVESQPFRNVDALVVHLSDKLAE